MADPLTLAIAAAVAGKAVELAGKPVKDGIAALFRSVRERLRGRPACEKVLTDAITDPDDGSRIAALAETLRHEMERDPAFAEDLDAGHQRATEESPEFRVEVHGRLKQIRMNAAASDEGVINVFNGNAEKVVQLRDVHGDLNIN